jgi:hypothetical protein
VLTVHRYSNEDRSDWNAFVESSKNGHFMFNREYMEYHSNRFEDSSLIIRDSKERIVALLPANKIDDVLYSHQGLTFGGLVIGLKVSTVQVLEFFTKIIEFMRAHRFVKLVYKRIPDLYTAAPSQEDLYALFRNDARLIRCDLNSTIDLRNIFSYSKGRKWSVNKARKEKLVCIEENDLKPYWLILEQALEKYGVKPTHTLEEITFLKENFNKNIRLFCTLKNDILLAGTLVYVNKEVVHTQYMATTDEGRELGALDFCIDVLLKDLFKDSKYLDFGISTENSGMYLNEGLLSQKEGFGARATVHQFYEINLK